MFDLPVVEKEDRKLATRFRKYLLDEGFCMAQYSVYYRMLNGRDAALAMERRIEKHIPPTGSVHILNITDKQYENLRVFESRSLKSAEKLDQLTLF